MSGNTYGKLFTVTSFGESHGPAIGCVVDGCPPGMEVSEADIQHDLDRRKPGKSRHTTQRREPDAVQRLFGIFRALDHGHADCADDPKYRPAGQGLQKDLRSGVGGSAMIKPAPLQVGRNILYVAGVEIYVTTSAGETRL